jgi:hypothetical protein
VVPTAAAPSVVGIVNPALSGGAALAAPANNDALQQWQVPDPVFDEECIPMNTERSAGDAALDQAGPIWEDARDSCFAEETWSAANAGYGATVAAEQLDGPVDQFLAVAAGLVGVAGRYWSAQEAESEKRRAY